MATHHGWQVVGFIRGYSGLLTGESMPLGPRAVSNVIQRGGTILKTARCQEFLEEEGRLRAKEVLEREGVEALVTIGGDGTLRGAIELGKVWSGQLVGAPGTIDNDLYGTDETIGYDTAVNTALEAIDKIRDTASSHERLFLVEVMGRRTGFIALEVGTAGGAEEIFVPESTTNIDACCERLVSAREKGKAMSILVVAEGDDAGGAFSLAEQIREKTGLESRVTILGHIQRGGRPTARDRVLATKLGSYAVEAITNGDTGIMVGQVAGKLTTTPLEDCISQRKELDPFLLKLIHILAN